MNTIYVPLDEVILLLHTNFPLAEQERTLRNALKDIEYLPTIDLSVIDEMIKNLEELKKGYSNKDLTGVYVHEKANLRIETLKEVKEKLFTNN